MLGNIYKKLFFDEKNQPPITTSELLLERDSVCMGDDATAPNARIIGYGPDTRLSQILGEIAANIPTVFSNQHTIWAIENNKCPIAYIESNASGHITTHLAATDMLISALDNNKVFCRYFYEYQGSLCSKLCKYDDGKWKPNHPECATLLEHVKMYYGA